MKLKILQENLEKALSVSSRFISTRTQLPVLANILLSAKKTKLQVAATNLETSVSISLSADVQKEGEITVPGKTVSEIVSNLSAGTINLEADKEQLGISMPNFDSTLAGMNSADFPSIPSAINKNEGIVLPKETLLEAISQVSFSASVDETRPILTGILFIFKKDLIAVVATDGFRLSQKKIKTNISPKEEKIILPRGALLEVARIAQDAEEVVLVFDKKENQALFGIDETILSSRVLEGEFPDFEKIIPKTTTTKISLDKEELAKAVRLGAVFARESANIITFKTGKGFLDLRAESQTSGNQTTRVDAKIEGDDKLEIAFNFRFLEEFLHATKGEEVKIELSGPSSPGIFADSQDPSFLHLIMPVRVQG